MRVSARHEILASQPGIECDDSSGGFENHTEVLQNVEAEQRREAVVGSGRLRKLQYLSETWASVIIPVEEELAAFTEVHMATAEAMADGC